LQSPYIKHYEELQVSNLIQANVTSTIDFLPVKISKMLIETSIKTIRAWTLVSLNREKRIAFGTLVSCASYYFPVLSFCYLSSERYKMRNK
jgi:hypothetical protein